MGGRAETRQPQTSNMGAKNLGITTGLHSPCPDRVQPGIIHLSLEAPCLYAHPFRTRSHDIVQSRSNKGDAPPPGFFQILPSLDAMRRILVFQRSEVTGEP